MTVAFKLRHPCQSNHENLEALEEADDLQPPNGL